MNRADTDTSEDQGAPSAGLMRRTADALRSLLGLHRRFAVDGVRYTERGAESLRRALSRRGPGRKDFDVSFPGGAAMRIRATPWREYADLGLARLRPVYASVDRLIRPGMRLLDAGAGTGYGAAWLVERVGPSGAVVALERDRESVRYAAARYPAPNVAFECGWLESLTGETDGSFDGVVCCDAIRDRDDPEKALTELWRLVAPGGWMLIGAPVPGHDGGSSPDGHARAFMPAQMVELIKAVAGALRQDDSGDGPDAAGTSSGNAPADVPDSISADGGGRIVVLIRRPDR